MLFADNLESKDIGHSNCHLKLMASVCKESDEVKNNQGHFLQKCNFLLFKTKRTKDTYSMAQLVTQIEWVTFFLQLNLNK